MSEGNNSDICSAKDKEDRSLDDESEETANDDLSSNEKQKDCEPIKEIKKSSRKKTSPKKKGSDNLRKRPASTSGVPIRKKRKVSLETVQAEYDSKLAKNTDLPTESVASREDRHKHFKCDKCGSPFITNPMKRGNKAKRSKLLPSPRHKLDPDTKKILSLCNACGLAFNRPKKVKKIKVQPSAADKQQNIEEGQKFASSLIKVLGDEEAERLYCTYYTKTPCGCIQRFIGDGKSLESLKRARMLLEITLKAKDYKGMKASENNQDVVQDENQDEMDDGSEISSQKKNKKIGRRSKIGLGNSQKKSKPFETYVLEQRAWLKKKYGFCETGTKKVLRYSNNFLHKRLKTDPEQQCRVVRQKGKFALGKLNSIEDLPKEQCCVDNCVRMALTHKRLLEEWREKSERGQAEARRVIAEMLTPSGGSRTNCYKFISWVTGRSLTTIGKVNDQMKKTGGNREPPEHGLKKWWKNHPKPKKDKAEAKPAAKSTAADFSHDSTAPIIPQAAFVQPPLSILQAAVNSSGLTAVIQNQQQQQPTQQQQQFGQANSNPLIVPQSFITIQTVQGAPYAIPVNTLQLPNHIQLLQLLQQQQQQQQSPQIAVALNPAANITRQQHATAPTMVSNSSQPSTFVIATATPNILGSMNETCVTPLLSAPPQQNPQAITSQPNVQAPAQYLQIAPVAAAPSSLLLQNSLTGLFNLTPQLQTGVLPSSGNFNVVPPVNLSIASSGNLNAATTLASTCTLNIPSSGGLNLISSNSVPVLPQMTSATGADQFLSNDATMALYNAGNVNSLLGTQPGQLIAQSTNSSIQGNSAPMQVSFITSG